MGAAAVELAAHIARLGPVPFADFVELALYHPVGGFYSGGGGAGRGRDFLTSPEVGPLFGAVVARALDATWRRLGEPDPFVVVECGAGRGKLAADVLAAAPACAAALRYVLVERSETLRAEQAALLPLEAPAHALGPTAASTPGDDDDRPRHLSNAGPLVVSLGNLPVGAFIGVVLANELLDNLPFGLLERTDAGWSEVRVAVGPAGFREVLVGWSGDDPVAVAPTGARVPVQSGAAAWVHAATSLIDRGTVIAIDYASTTAQLATRPWQEWVRTYRGHGRGMHPLDVPGEQDITCEVAVDQLPAPSRDRSQAEFLRDHGIDDLAAAARAAWQARAHIGDLEALEHRSRVTEAAALTDPTGLGAFRVLEWDV